MSDDAVTYRSQDGIAIITINRAERMNRLDDAIVEDLHHAWQRLMATDEDRVAVLTGAGDKAFRSPASGLRLAEPPAKVGALCLAAPVALRIHQVAVILDRR